MTLIINRPQQVWLSAAASPRSCKSGISGPCSSDARRRPVTLPRLRFVERPALDDIPTK
jgi:hypothetical protein